MERVSLDASDDGVGELDGLVSLLVCLDDDGLATGEAATQNNNNLAGLDELHHGLDALRGI